MNLFFGYEGRINRLQWWMGQTGLIAILIGFFIFVGESIGDETGTERLQKLGSTGMLLLVTLVLALWINSALCVKRYHDRDKSGFWFFICFVPVIGAIWQFVELGCMPGTKGGNTYGDDPNGGSFSFDGIEAEIAEKYGRQRGDTAQAFNPISEPQAYSNRQPQQVMSSRPAPRNGGTPSFGRRGI